MKDVKKYFLLDKSSFAQSWEKGEHCAAYRRFHARTSRLTSLQAFLSGNVEGDS